MASQTHDVIVIGAGPVGLFTALLLAQAGIKTIVFESADGISQAPRAAASPARNGREKHGTSNGQNILCDILSRHFVKLGGNIVFNHAFVRAEQNNGIISAFVERRIDKQQLPFKARYLVGADGGRSAVRNSLGLSLEGYTWEDLQLVAVNMIYDLDQYGWKPANFIVDPVDWAIILKRGPGNAWRVATSIPRTDKSQDVALDGEAVLPIIKDRISRLLPGNSEEIIYLQAAPYTIHQRCAPKFNEGNIVLVGDAAHLNNPVGGLGLTTGLLDAAHLGKGLRQIFLDGRDSASTIS